MRPRAAGADAAPPSPLWQRPAVHRLAVLAGGGATALSFPPLDLWFLAPLGLAVAIGAAGGRTWRGRALIGGLFGFGFFGGGLLLVTSTAVPAEVLAAEAVAAAALAVFPAVALAATPPGGSRVAGAVAAFVLTAAVRARWPLGGLPSVGLVLGQSDGPFLAAARLGGELAVVAAVVATASALASWRRPRAGAVPAAIAVLLVGVAHLVGDGRPVERLDLAVVQGGGDIGVGARPFEETYERHVTTARRATGADLVVLPESVVHADAPVLESAQGRGIGRLPELLDATVVAGLSEWIGDDRFYNTAVVWSPEGEPLDRYEKRRGVPFGEYVPGRSFIDRFADLSIVPRDLVAGDAPGVLQSPVGRIGVAISFEVFSGALVRETVAEGAELLVVPSNTGSFPNAHIAELELAISRVRAVETGRWVVQATPTGVSAVVSPSGRVVDRTEVSEDATVLRSSLVTRRGTTPAVRLGDGPWVLGAIALLVASWWWERRPVGGFGERFLGRAPKSDT